MDITIACSNVDLGIIGSDTKFDCGFFLATLIFICTPLEAMFNVSISISEVTCLVLPSTTSRVSFLLIVTRVVSSGNSSTNLNLQSGPIQTV